MRDFKKLQDDPPVGVCAAPTEHNIMQWNAVIFGPLETPFEDGTFKLKMKFSEDYPNVPPDVRFISPMFHPNVYSDGQICLDIFQNRWSPTYDVEAILTSIQSLLNDPNPNSPANNEAATLFRENKREYERRIHDIVQQSWENDDEDDILDCAQDEKLDGADSSGIDAVGAEIDSLVDAEDLRGTPAVDASSHPSSDVVGTGDVQSDGNPLDSNIEDGHNN